MKKSKKVLALILALTMLIGLIPISSISITVFAEPSQSGKLGYGFNALTGDVNNPEAGIKSNQILSGFQSEMQPASKRISTFISNASKAEVANQYSESLNASLSAKVPIYSVNVGIDAKFSSTTEISTNEIKSEKWELYFSQNQTSKNEIVNMGGAQGASLLLSDNFSELIDTIKKESNETKRTNMIDTVFSIYGTHIITSYFLGGQLEVANHVYSSTLTQSALNSNKSSLEMSLKEGSTSLDTTVSGEYKTTNTNTNTSTYEKGIITNIGGNYDDKSELTNAAYMTWQNSLSAKPSIIGFVNSDSLLPIWEVISDPQLRAEVENRYEMLLNGVSNGYLYQSAAVNTEYSFIPFDNSEESLFVAPGSTIYLNLPGNNSSVSVSESALATVIDASSGAIKIANGLRDNTQIPIIIYSQGVRHQTITFIVKKEGAGLYAGGYGTEKRPYFIQTYADFQNIVKNRDSYFLLLNDINVKEDITFADEQFIAIPRFDGFFDGQNYSIFNFEMTKSSSKTFLGVFEVNYGIIKNLKIGKNYLNDEYAVIIRADNAVGADIEYDVGVIAGANYGTIFNCSTSNCYAENIFKDADDQKDCTGTIGGIVAGNLGIIDYCCVENCHFKNVVNLVANSAETNNGTAGGIAAGNLNGKGVVTNSIVRNSTIESHVHEDGFIGFLGYREFGVARSYVGGIVGLNQSGSKAYNCLTQDTVVISKTYHDGGVKGSCDNCCGSIVGYDSGSNIFSCAGINNTFTASCNNGHTAYSGGIVGLASRTSTIKNNYTDSTSAGFRYDNETSWSGNVSSGQSLNNSGFYDMIRENAMWKQDKITGEFYFSKESQETLDNKMICFVKDVSDTKIEMQDISAFEYSLNNVDWQKSPTFSNLAPNETYCIYIRFAETNKCYEGDASAPLYITTLKRSVAAPATPRKSAVTSNSVTLITVSGCEYSMDGVTWQNSPVFSSGLDPDTQYTFYQRYAETETAYASTSSVGAKIKTDKSTPSTPGAPTILSYTDTTVTLKAIGSCEYSKNGTSWQDSNAFTGLAPNTSYTFYQRVKAGEHSYASASSAGTRITTKKTTPSIPGAPTIESYTDTTVTLKTVSGCEYSRDGVTWQNSPMFSGLDPDTSYTFYQRYAATETAYASEKSTGYTVKTDKFMPDAPDAPTAKNITATSVELYAVTNCEYSIDGIHWQDETVFGGLSAATEYSFYQRIKEGVHSYPSDVSEALVVRTAKSENNDTPSEPSLLRKTATTVTLRSIADAEYKCGNGSWQTSNVFTGLTPNTKYRFYVRYAETETALASAASPALEVETDKESAPAPTAPTAKTITAVSVTLNAIENGEYSMDGVTWQNAPTFTGLSPATTYSFYQRTGETEEYAASDASTSIMLRTDKSMSEAPEAPTVQTYSSDSVTLNPVNGCEYSIDGTNWQSSTYFGGLKANTQYTFYQRVAETSTAYASASSSGTTITTDKATVTAPAAPTVDAKTANSVTVTPVEGCEYKINDGAWQTNNVFTGLTSNTEYVIYQRFAETNSTKASEASAGVAVTTDRVISATDPQMIIGTKTARAGETVTLFFELKNAPELKSIAISGITYDSSALDLISGEWKATNSILQNWNSSNQTAAIAFADNTNVNGVAFALTFKVKTDTEDGSYPIDCSITAKTKVASGAEENVVIPTIKGNVNVVSVIRGDVNGDNLVTSDDAIQVLYYTLLPDIYTVNQDVDFNGDGLVTSDDAIHLLYYTLLPDLYPLH